RIVEVELEFIDTRRQSLLAALLRSRCLLSRGLRLPTARVWARLGARPSGLGRRILCLTRPVSGGCVDGFGSAEAGQSADDVDLRFQRGTAAIASAHFRRQRPGPAAGGGRLRGVADPRQRQLGLALEELVRTHPRGGPALGRELGELTDLD